LKPKQLQTKKPYLDPRFNRASKIGKSMAKLIILKTNARL